MKHIGIRGHAIGLTILFGLQFLAGMTLNLFVRLPAAHPGTKGNNYLLQDWHSLVWALTDGGGVVLATHVYLALALVLGCLALLVRAGVAQNSQRWIWVSGIATLFTLGACINGLSFLDYDQNLSSIIMASCWLIAVGALIFGIIRPLSRVAAKTH